MRLMMRNIIRRLQREQGGFTLLEMATVTAIMAALAAIVAVAVTLTSAETAYNALFSFIQVSSHWHGN